MLSKLISEPYKRGRGEETIVYFYVKYILSLKERSDFVKGYYLELLSISVVMPTESALAVTGTLMLKHIPEEIKQIFTIMFSAPNQGILCALVIKLIYWPVSFTVLKCTAFHPCCLYEDRFVTFNILYF